MIAVSSVTQARLFLNEKSRFCRKSVRGRRTTGLSRDAHGAPPGMKKKSAAYPLPKQNGEDMRMFLRFALRKKRGKRETAKPRFLVLRDRFRSLFLDHPDLLSGFPWCDAMQQQTISRKRAARRFERHAWPQDIHRYVSNGCTDRLPHWKSSPMRGTWRIRCRLRRSVPNHPH